MADLSHVPKFGNWENEEDVPYTAYFDKARKVRSGGGKMTNPADPEENVDLYSEYGASRSQTPPPKARPRAEELTGQTHTRSPLHRPRSFEENDLKQITQSPLRQENMHRRASEDYHNQRNGGQGARPARVSGGSENNSAKIPAHHPRTPGRNVAAPSPLWEGSKGSHDGIHGPSGRSKGRPHPKGEESPDKGAAVPKFGEWDENNPSSADGYTHIFNKVREERNYGGPAPGTPRTANRSDARRPPPSDSVKSCCFCFGTK